jgi:hypothetical protein
MMNHRIFAFLAVLVLVFAITTGASAAGAGAVTFTQNDHNVTQSFSSSNPCTGDAGIVTTTGNSVFHVTTLTSGIGIGTSWATGTSEGTFTFVPTDPTKPSYTGHFTTWFGDNNNLKNGTETSTLTIHGVGSDGSTIRFHEVVHLLVDANDVVKLFFDKPTCG